MSEAEQILRNHIIVQEKTGRRKGGGEDGKEERGRKRGEVKKGRRRRGGQRGKEEKDKERAMCVLLNPPVLK